MNLAVFYHCLFTGGSRPIDIEFACSLMAEQMASLKASGLESAAKEIHIGINGPESDAEIARLFAPAKARIHCHGAGSTTEIPTLNLLRAWAQSHKDWLVFNFHMKGVTHPPLDGTWRRGMQQALISNWKMAAHDVQNGYDACGCHWLTPEKYPGIVAKPFFGGNYWWSKASYVAQLPPLPEAIWENRYEAETWIGSGVRRPRVKEYISGWPTHGE